MLPRITCSNICLFWGRDKVMQALKLLHWPCGLGSAVPSLMLQPGVWTAYRHHETRTLVL